MASGLLQSATSSLFKLLWCERCWGEGEGRHGGGSSALPCTSATAREAGRRVQICRCLRRKPEASAAPRETAAQRSSACLAYVKAARKNTRNNHAERVICID